MRSRSGSLASQNVHDNVDIESLLRTAQIVAGNFHPIDPALVERVKSLVNWVNSLPAFTSERKEAVALQLRKLLANRLRLSADRRRIPAIAEEKIERPIFVIGFARTGTTLIHTLLAEDPHARAPLWWHSHAPSPPPGEHAVTEYRIRRTEKELDEVLDLTPGLLALHPYWDKGGYTPIEDEEIFTLDFQNANPNLIYKIPALALILDASNIAEAYRFHREFLQHHQWNCEPGHWVLKGIYHQFSLDALFEAYPDALCIWPHRDPVQVHSSTLAITSVYYGGISGWQMDFKELGPVFVRSVAESVTEAMDNPLVDDPRIVHVDFRELTKGPVEIIRKAYHQWGLDFTPEYEARIKAWLDDPGNASDRYGSYEYAMEPFGLSREMIETAFEDYSRRFRLGRFA